MKRSNMLTIKLTDANVQLSYFNYNKELLNELRKTYDRTHAFFRYRIDGNDVIIVFPIYQTSSVIIDGATPITINPVDNVVLAKKFVHELIFRKVLDSGASVEQYNDIKFLSRRISDNAFSQIMPSETKIGYKKGFELSSRVFFTNKYPQIYLSIDVFYRWDINVTCDELIKKGANLQGVYVCVNQTSDLQLLADKRVLIGKIKTINADGTCLIEKDGTNFLTKQSELYIENNIHNRDRAIKNYLGAPLYNKCVTHINTNTPERKSAKSKITAATAISAWLSKTSISNGCGFEFYVGNYFDDKNPDWNNKQLNSPAFIFDLHQAKTSSNPDKGVKDFGPYDKDIFDKKTPNIAVLCLKKDRGTVTEFINKLNDGLPKITSGNGFLPYGKGLKDKYHLNAINTFVFEIENETLESYSSAISNCISSGNEFDLAIVQSSVQYKEYDYKDSPYLLSKSKFMSSNIPVQEINIETMRKTDNNLAWILNNIALASYSKMGGNPWLIPSNKSIDRELIIGLGSSVFKNGRFKNDKRIVGITTVFNSDGTYLLANKSKEVRFENYFSELKNNLEFIFSEVQKSEGWIKGDNIRLVFHCFKPFKNKEIDAIISLTNSLCKDYNVKFAFIHVSNFHKLFWIDDNNVGETSYSGKKGEWMPTKGSMLKLDEHNCLIQITGAKDIKMASHGMATPILLSLHEKSTYVDLDYLSQQLYYFTFMSYRSFSSSPLPVTIWYSQLIAQLLGGLSFLPQWDSDVMNNNLKYSRWFL